VLFMCLVIKFVLHAEFVFFTFEIIFVDSTENCCETECCKWFDVLWKRLIPHVLNAYLSKTPLPGDIYWSIFGSDCTI